MELPLNLMLKSLPKPHQDWIKKVKEELQLPEVEIIVRMDTTTMRPQEAIQVCIEERVPLFCAGLGNPGFMVAEAHAAGMKVLGITGNAKNARRMAQSGIDLLVAQGYEGEDTQAELEQWLYFPKLSMPHTQCLFWQPAALEMAGGLLLLWPWVASGCGSGPAFWPRMKQELSRSTRSISSIPQMKILG
jgi:hypothetical protein